MDLRTRRSIRDQPARIPLWFLRHASGHTIECSVNMHPRGLEFRATMNADLLHSQVFGSAQELLRSAVRGKNLLESRGWTMAGDTN